MTDRYLHQLEEDLARDLEQVVREFQQETGLPVLEARLGFANGLTIGLEVTRMPEFAVTIGRGR